jgi:nucleoside phosphorylase
MSLVYVFAAAAFEAKPVRQIAAAAAGTSSESATLHCGPNELHLITGGMGPKLAQKAAGAALLSASRKPDALLIIGLCGGLTASLPEGRIVAYTDCLSTESAKPPLRCSESLTNSLVSLLASSSIQCDSVAGVTSPRIATTRDERLALATCGAAVVDMESYPIVEAAWMAGVPAMVLRVVSDSLDRDLPDFNRALNEAGSLDGRKALKVALGSPLQTAKLLAANKRAMQHLSRALTIVLLSDCFANAISAGLR